MPSAFNVEFNTFIRGLITEANPLTYPENASLDEVNFIIDRNGSRSRRKGMDYEANYQLNTSSMLPTEAEQARLDTFLWDNVADNENLLFGVIRTGNELWFIDLNTVNPSASLKNNGLPVYIGIYDGILDIAAVSGSLVIVDSSQSVFTLSYDIATDTITQTSYRITVRDFLGVESDLKVTERPYTLSAEHRYNLHNQGWPQTKQLASAGTKDYIEQTKTSLGRYPALTDDWSTAMKTVSSNGNEVYHPPMLYDYSTELSKGKFVIDLFNRGASRQDTSHYELPIDRSEGGIVAVSNFASRIWYGFSSISVDDGDAKSPSISTIICFSRIIQNLDDVANCYQAADPTSREISDIVDTDGGHIIIPEMNNIQSLASLGRSLLVFAQNGVWEIRGSGSEESFIATSYQVNRLSSSGAVSKSSIVVAEDNVAYWSEGGIYLVSRDNLGSYAAANMTESTIQTLYNEIPAQAKARAVGTYEPADRTVKWLYNGITDSNDADKFDGLDHGYRLTTELLYDLTLQAWYKNEISRSSTTPFVSGYISTSGFISSFSETDVVNNADQLVTKNDDIEAVTIPTSSKTESDVKTKYLVTTRDATLTWTIGEYSDGGFRDWLTFGEPLDAAAYLVTGYFTGGDTQRHKNAYYLITHCSRTETGYVDNSPEDLEFVNPSSCIMQPRWEWTSYSDTHQIAELDTRWGRATQVYKYKRLYLAQDDTDELNYPFDVITTKSKIRGKGRALSLLFKTEPKKDMVLLGWGLSGEMTTKV
jgi:hypothetical protein